jgi:oxygen-dependent protoporphyrinogen oxidase
MLTAKRPTLLLLLLLASASSLLLAPAAPRAAGARAPVRAASRAAFAARMAETTTDCLVVGAGISGSTLAHNLHCAGVDLLLTEARDYVGGNVKSHVTDDGYVWEEGPNSFATQPSIVRAAYELGIADQLVFADESLPPWVNHNGKLHPLPKGKGGKGAQGQLELVFGSNGVLKFGLLGELLSWPGKIRAAVGALVGHAPPPPGTDETIREWVTRTLGEEVFLRCIDPFVSGVYAGDPETLSMKAALSKIARIERISYGLEWNKFGAIFYGGLARQVELTKERKADPPDPRWPAFEYGNPGSFRRGLATLPNAIAAELGAPVDAPPRADSRVRLGWRLTRIERDGAGYLASFETAEGVETVRAKAVVSTVPAHALGGVLAPVMPAAACLVDKVREEIGRVGIYHPPVYAVTVAYPEEAFRDIELPNGFGPLRRLPGFGLLNPRSEGVRTLGTLWSSSLFPGRAPPGHNLLLNYIGGSRDPAIAELSEEEVVAEVHKGCLQTLLRPGAAPPKVLGVKLWPTAIPQYELGHTEILAELERAEAATPGLWVCGNYRSGVAFPDCVTFGYEQAQVVARYLDALPGGGRED